MLVPAAVCDVAEEQGTRASQDAPLVGAMESWSERTLQGEGAVPLEWDRGGAGPEGFSKLFHHQTPRWPAIWVTGSTLWAIIQVQ